MAIPEKPAAGGPPGAAEESPTGHSVYTDYIREQLEAQEARKQSLEQRGVAVISTSGVLVSLLFGASALAAGGDGVEMSTGASIVVFAALALFVIAAVGAIVTNLPLAYAGATVDGLREAVAERWSDPEAVATEMTSLTRLKMLDSARANNNIKAWALVAALACEIAAVALVGVAVGIVLWD